MAAVVGGNRRDAGVVREVGELPHVMVIMGEGEGGRLVHEREGGERGGSAMWFSHTCWA